MNLELLRFQHGIGQGGFHTSSFVLRDKDKRPCGSFVLVFDCGTLSSGPHGESPADFLSAEICTSMKPGQVVDAFFISHLDNDHLSGAEELCNRCNVRRVFLPYFEQEELVLFVAQNILSNKKSALGPTGLAIAVKALGGGSLFGAPVTRIGGPPVDGEREQRGDEPLTEGEPRIGVVQVSRTGFRSTLGGSLPNGSGIGLSVAGIHIPWLLLPWSYKQSPVGLAQLLTDVPELGKVCFGAATVTARDMEELIALRPRIRASLTKIIKAAGGIYASDFNAPSICLYSGPLINDPRIHRQRYLDRGTTHSLAQKDPIGWVTTGDAILSKYEPEFFSMFDPFLNYTGTYVLPHHGSLKNHSLEFVKRVRGRFALICARSGSKDHPHPYVLADLATFSEEHRILTQYLVGGVKETVSMTFRL